MKIYLLSITVIITLFAFASTSPAASFDCAKASTKIEKMICADEYLLAFDDGEKGETKGETKGTDLFSDFHNKQSSKINLIPFFFKNSV